MPYQLFQLPKATLFSSGTLQPGWSVRFYLTGTTTPTPVYTTSALDPGSVHTQPIVADAAGILAAIYLDPSIVYKVAVYNAAGALQYETDPANDSVISSAIIAATLDSLKRTPAEISAGVTPTNGSYEPYTSRRYGMVFDNTTDDRAALVNMLAAAAANSSKYSGTVAKLSAEGLAAPVAAKVSDGITYDPALLTLDGQGHTLDFSTKTSGAFSGVKLDSAFDSGEPNAQALYTSVKALRNLLIVMPSYLDNASGVGLEVVDSVGDGAGSYRTNCGTVENVAICGGKYGVKLGNGVFGWEFTNLRIGNEAGHNLDTAVYSTVPRIDHEFDKFRGGFIFNCLYAYDYAFGYAIITDQNIDGARTIGRLSDTGYLQFANGYSEFVDGDDTQYKFSNSNTNGVIEIANWVFNLRPDILATRTLDFAECSAGNMTFRGCTFIGQNTAWFGQPFLVTGAGQVTASGLIYKNVSWAPLPHKRLQWLAYPDCNNANALAAFTLSNVGAGDDPVRATGISDGASTRDAFHFSINAGGVNNDESSAAFTHAVAPGKRVSVVGQYFSNDLTGSNTRLEVFTQYLDVDGNSVSSLLSNTVATADAATWTTFGCDGDVVPAGAETISVTIRLRATGAVAGNTELYISPLGIGYADGI